MKKLFCFCCRRSSAAAAASHPRRYLWWLLCLPAAGGLTLAARRLPGFAEAYAARVYPLLAQPVNFLTGLLPFSVMEVLCTALLAAVPVLLFLFVRRLVRLPDRRARLRFAAAVVT